MLGRRQELWEEFYSGNDTLLYLFLRLRLRSLTTSGHQLKRVPARGPWKKEKTRTLSPFPKTLHMITPQNTCWVDSWDKRHIIMFGFSFMTFPSFLLCWASLCEAILGNFCFLNKISAGFLYSDKHPRLRFLQAARFSFWAIFCQQLGISKLHCSI